MSDEKKAGGAEQEALRLYPPSVVKWETERGIVREMKNGAMYIRALDMDALTARMVFDEEDHKRAMIQQRIAEEQEKAYLKGD